MGGQNADDSEFERAEQLGHTRGANIQSVNAEGLFPKNDPNRKRRCNESAGSE